MVEKSRVRKDWLLVEEGRIGRYLHPTTGVSFLGGGGGGAEVSASLIGSRHWFTPPPPPIRGEGPVEPPRLGGENVDFLLLQKEFCSFPLF